MLASCNGIRHFRADDIIDTKDANQSQVRLLNILDLSIDRLVVLFTVLAGFKVTVSDSNRSEGSLCILVDDSLHLGNSVVI